VLLLAIGWILVACAPVVEPAPVTTNAERSDLEIMAGCVTEAGFEVTVDDDSLSSGSMSEAQLPVFNAVVATCQEDNGLFPAVALEDLDWDTFYASTLAATDCVRGQGYEVPDAPSRRVFEETYATHPYSPYFSLPQLSPGEFSSLEAACPQPRF
jgi:hypothetical protein